MAEVTLIEDAKASISRIVWVVKGPDEDWGTMRDEFSRPFNPNRVCLVVRTIDGRTFSNWMQVRHHYYGDPARPDQEMCSGVLLFEGAYPEYAPAWLLAARDLAVQSVATIDGSKVEG